MFGGKKSHAIFQLFKTSDLTCNREYKPINLYYMSQVFLTCN